jgi:hypothetical protein
MANVINIEFIKNTGIITNANSEDRIFCVGINKHNQISLYVYDEQKWFLHDDFYAGLQDFYNGNPPKELKENDDYYPIYYRIQHE